jgi:DNA-binding NtrC family response regulator
LVDILEDKGYSVESENTAQAAINKVKEKFFDVVLLDIRMPVMNGVEAFKQIKKISPKTAVIMMTAYSAEDLIRESLANGAFGVLRKPIDIDKMVEQIELAKEKSTLILVVDDDPSTKETFKDVLEEKGYRVASAKTGEEAIEISRQRPQDILFIDMKLPVLNGLETYLAVKEINPTARAVIITGYKEEMRDLIEQALKASAYACISKPIDMDKILKVIEEITSSKEKR